MLETHALFEPLFEPEMSRENGGGDLWPNASHIDDMAKQQMFVNSSIDS